LKILCAVESKFLKLTKIDEEIYNEFRNLFKDFNVGLIDVDVLKSNESKEVFNLCFHRIKGLEVKNVLFFVSYGDRFAKRIRDELKITTWQHCSESTRPTITARKIQH